MAGGVRPDEGVALDVGVVGEALGAVEMMVFAETNSVVLNCHVRARDTRSL